MTQFLFNFSKYLTDSDGVIIAVNQLHDTIKTIADFCNCTKKEAIKTLAILEKSYDVYSADYQIILTEKNCDAVQYNFEIFGETYGTSKNPHKYNTLGKWEFIAFLENKITKKQQPKPKIKQIELTCTELQIKRANQLLYAHSIGFSIGISDYTRFYLM